MKIDYIEATRHPGDKTRLTIYVDEKIENLVDLVGQARNKPYELKLTPMQKSRSLDANAFYQKVLDLLAKALVTSRDEVHEMMLCRYGVTKCREDGSPIVFPTEPNQDGHDIARYCEVIKEGSLNGKPCLWWRIVKGSSEMTTEEFSHLLDGILSECKEIGVVIPDEADYRRETSRS